MANKFRGEVEITLAGKSFTLRPTFEALVEFEDRAGVTAYEALRDIAERQRAPAKVVAAALWAGIRGGADPDTKPPSLAEVGAMIQREGISTAMGFAFTFLTNALCSDDELRRVSEAQAQAGKPETRTE